MIFRSFSTTKPISFLFSIALFTTLLFTGFTSSVSAVTFTRRVFLQNVTTNSIEFRWVTDTHEQLVVKYGTTTSYGAQVVSDTVSGTGGSNNHAKITGLSANTKYFYQVTTTGGTALTPAGDANHYFRTSPPVGSTAPVTFAFWGDSGDSSSAQNDVAKWVFARKPDITFIAGDIAYGYTTDFNNNNGLYFNHYSDATPGQNSMSFSPFYVTCGNHETSCSTVIADHSLPSGGSRAGQSTYSFDYGNVHFVALNSNGSYSYPSDPQMAWALNDLKSSSQPWKVIFWHHNGWSAGSHSTDQTRQDQIGRLAQDGGAQMVFWGHSHVYERWNRKAGFYPNTQFYTIGNGGRTGSSGCSTTSPGPGCAAKSTSSTTHGFLFAQVSGNQMKIDYISNNAVADTTTLTSSGSVTVPPSTNTPTPTRVNTVAPTASLTPQPTVPGQTATPTRINTSTPRPTVTLPPGSLPGDANGDGKVDGIDLVIWMSHYGQTTSGVSNGDFNNDGKVDGVDYVIWFTNYGRTGTVTSTPVPGGQVLLRVEAGGSADYTDSAGNVWDADNGFSGGTTIDRGNISISNTQDARIYQTERYGMSGYGIPVTNGAYHLKLHFAETSGAITGPGQRVFNVYSEGQLLVSNLDVFAEAGGKNRALVKSFDVQVQDGLLNLGFIASVQTAEINGIEISSSNGTISTATPTRINTVTPRPTNTPIIATGTPVPNPTGGTGTNPLTDCSQYTNPKRIFLETQAWWMATSSIGTSQQIPVNGIGGHAHTATCFPEDQQISGGTLHFNVRLMLHKGNPGQVQWLDIGLGPDGTSIARVNLPNLTCAGSSDVTKQCEWWIPIDLDTSRVPSGYQELRFRFNVSQPNGERQFASTGWQAWYHGGTSTYRTPPFLEARGWYTGVSYANSRVTSPVPYSPVSGILALKISANPGSGGAAVANHAVHVDARFNFDDFGKVYGEGNGGFSGTVNIDTTQLTNGRHCVAIRTSSISSNGGTNTGILQFPITVNNPGAATGNGRGGCQPGT